MLSFFNFDWKYHHHFKSFYSCQVFFSDLIQPFNDMLAELCKYAFGILVRKFITSFKECC